MCLCSLTLRTFQTTQVWGGRRLGGAQGIKVVGNVHPHLPQQRLRLCCSFLKAVIRTSINVRREEW